MEQALARALALRAEDRFPTVEAFVEALLAAAEAGPARFTADDVRDIVGRAARLELTRPTGDGLFTVGGVERIAAEVGIPVEDVRRALEELRPTLERGVRLPAPRALPPAVPVPPGAPAVAIERIVEATVPASHLGTLTDEVQLALGPGAATMWEGELTWRSQPTGGLAPRQLEVFVAPGTNATRIRITEWGERFAPKVIGALLGLATGLPFGAFLGVLLSGIDPGLRYLGAMAGGVTGVNVFVRAAITTHRRQREAELARLADRLAASITLAAGELPPPVPPPPMLPRLPPSR
jgi:hypothetical protein